MIRMIPFLAFVLLAGRGFSQNIDSLVAVRQVDSLIKVSLALTGQGDFDKALEINAVAEKIALEKLGRESAAYGSCNLNRGWVFYINIEYAEAEKWYLEAIAIKEKVLGKAHPDYATSLSTLAILYRDMGFNEKAEPLLLEVKAIREKALGKVHLDYARSLGNLANFYSDMGDYEKAESFFLETLAILEKVIEKTHPVYASTLNNLAILYLVMGNYEKAEPLYLAALAIREKALGREHPEYANSLNNLANFYSDMGDYEKAKMLHLEAKAIREKVLGKAHPNYANSLNNLALLYKDMGDYEKAESLHLEAIAIREKVLGKEHPKYGSSLNNLANLYSDMGNYEKAEPLFLETITIKEKVLGKAHPDYAGSLINLADNYRLMGYYEKAEPLLLEAKGIFETLPNGRNHDFYSKCLTNLAIFYHSLGYYEKAAAQCIEETLVNRSLLEKAVRHLSEREMGSYLSKNFKSQDLAFSFAQVSDCKKVVPACFDNTLFYKGFLLNAANQVKRLAFSDSITTEKFNLLKSYERRLAAQYTQPIADRDSTEVTELEAQVNDLEKDLARTVAGYGEAMRQVNWQEVQQKLVAGEAAVEFVRYQFIEKRQSDTMYAALLLLPEMEQPEFIPLFKETQLDSLLSRLLGSGTAAKADNLYAARSIIPISPKNELPQNVFELLWQPLEESLKGVKAVYFSPAGHLSKLNLGAIPTGEGKILSDRYNLVQLGSTRQLVVPPELKIKNNDALLFGGIQYEMDSTAVNLMNIDLKINRLIATRGGLSFSQTDSTLRGGTWDFLPGTEKEVVLIEKIMRTSGIEPQARKGWAATEEAFKTIGQSGKPSPRILHLATHGFFFPDPKTVDFGRQTADGASVFKISDNPLIRSGLILSGGNLAWQTGKPLKPGMDDGILTAYEISQMNLANTELVVLSACETGLGDVQGNEGVYGLQRAFKIAGAKYLIMSLWQVPDQQTSLLMTAFYKKWLSEKMEIPVAFRAAQKELRDAGLAPYQWAGFVLVE